MEEKLQWISLLLIILTVAGVFTFSWWFLQKNLAYDSQQIFDKYLENSFTGNELVDARMNFFHMVHDGVTAAFPYLNLKEEHFAYDFNEIRVFYETVIMDEELTDASYLFAISEMLSLLDDPHTRLSDNLVEGVEKTLLVSLIKGGNQLYLADFHQVLRKNDEYMETMAIGDKLIKVDDRDAMELYNVLWENSVFAQYKETKALFLKRFFSTYYHQYLEKIGPARCKLDFQKNDGTTYTLLLDWNEAYGLIGVNGLVSSASPTRETQGEYIEDKNLAYIQINSLDMSNLSLFQSEMARMQYTDGLILDLRGVDVIHDHLDFERAILATFIDQPVKAFYRKTRASAYYFAFSDNPGEVELSDYSADYLPLESLTVSPASLYYKKPIVVLIDENNMLAPDALVVSLSKLAEAVLIGRGSELHVQGKKILVSTPYEGYGFYVSTSYLYDDLHQKIENERLEMRVEVPYSDQEAKGIVDPVLRAGIEWFAKEE